MRRNVITLSLLIILFGAMQPATALAAPTITLTPNRAICTTAKFPLTVRGTGFTPGQALELYDYNDGSDGQQIMGVRVGQAIVGADGTFATTIQLASCGPYAPLGMTFVITIFREEGLKATEDALASAVFTVGTAMPGLPNTGGGAAARPTASGAVAPLAMLALVLTGSRLARMLRRSEN